KSGLYAALSWSRPPDPDFSQYRIHVKVHLGGNQQQDYWQTDASKQYLLPNALVDFEVFALDTAGHESPGTGVLSVDPNDVTPPSPPPVLNTPTVGNRQVTLTWSASNDNVQLLGYEVSRNEQIISPSTFVRTTSFLDLDPTLTNGTAYNYK